MSKEFQAVTERQKIEDEDLRLVYNPLFENDIAIGDTRNLLHFLSRYMASGSDTDRQQALGYWQMVGRALGVHESKEENGFN